MSQHILVAIYLSALGAARVLGMSACVQGPEAPASHLTGPWHGGVCAGPDDCSAACTHPLSVGGRGGPLFTLSPKKTQHWWQHSHVSFVIEDTKLSEQNDMGRYSPQPDQPEIISLAQVD